MHKAYKAIRDGASATQVPPHCPTGSPLKIRANYIGHNLDDISNSAQPKWACTKRTGEQ